MKTYQEFYAELYDKKLITGRLDELAAKEYAKQWIDKATDELNDYNVGFPEAYKRVAALRRQIDAQ